MDRDYPLTLLSISILGLLFIPALAVAALYVGYASSLYPRGWLYPVSFHELMVVVVWSLTPENLPSLTRHVISAVVGYSADPDSARRWLSVYAKWWWLCSGAGAFAGLMVAIISGVRVGSVDVRPLRGRWLLIGRTAMRSAQREMRAECRAGGAGVRIHPQLQISRLRESESILFIGGQGSGKTTVEEWLVTSILRDEPASRLVIHDPKREYTARILSQPEAKGAILHALWDRRTVIWAVAEDIDSEIAAQELASRLVPPADGRNAIFADGAAAILTGLLVYLANRKKNEGINWGWADLRAAILQPFAEMRAVALEGNPDADIAENPASNPTASFLSNLKTQVAPLLRGLAVAEQEARSRKNFRAWSAREWIRGECGPRVVILQGSGNYKQLAEAVNGAIIQALVAEVSELEDSRSRRVWLMLDEFAQLGTIDGIEKFLETGRSKGICCFFATQQTKHFERYRNVNLPGLFSTVLLGKCRDEDATWAADYVGRQLITRRTQSQSGTPGVIAHQTNSITATEQHAESYVVYPHEFSGLGFRRRWFRPGIDALLLTGPDYVFRLWWPSSQWRNVTKSHLPALWTQSLKSKKAGKARPCPAPTQPAPPPKSVGGASAKSEQRMAEAQHGSTKISADEEAEQLQQVTEAPTASQPSTAMSRRRKFRLRSSSEPADQMEVR
ncbi:type IV secretion system DNA-binding domain-containing protein [Acidihalobacter prosperus]|uniref:Type IV secretion system coupling protein TraD DNA-binding domain-containing protein n=1 Tax=Acidihalobacter prosperus TaxID=160660 RepID=A0A1A6C108_9GAMM|nr:type IV secretion system DNA-binding domain-containing protein [Acidihalobacter prosperus]OBS08234.1 hypothetical protein Thpro_022484 [Acidihalobacter prosperus]